MANKVQSTVKLTDAKGTKPEFKDFYRIDTIMARAQGSTSKAERLATRMAQSITKIDKAMRRAGAAVMRGQNDLAMIFLQRAAELS